MLIDQEELPTPRTCRVELWDDGDYDIVICDDFRYDIESPGDVGDQQEMAPQSEPEGFCVNSEQDSVKI